MQTKQDGDQVVITYHLLQPKESETAPMHLAAGEVVAVQEQGVWRAVRLISRFAEGQDAGKWEYKNVIDCRRRSVDGGDCDKDHDAVLDQAKENLGILRRDDLW